jgi:hypothetical protein
MKAISLHQPWASLLVTRQPCDYCAWGEQHTAEQHSMVKRFETRSWPCPPSIIGQHVAFASTKRKPDVGHLGDWLIDRNRSDGAWMRRSTLHASIRLPLGCVVGSGIITTSYPITDDADYPAPCILTDGARLTLWEYKPEDPSNLGFGSGLEDQKPYGDWTSGRFAWEIVDAAPTTERCPWCRGAGRVNARTITSPLGSRVHNGDSCPVCNLAGRCDPIPVTGRQGFWNWGPT